MKQKKKAPKNVGKLMTQILGISPSSKHSTLIQNRIHKLIVSGHSPFSENTVAADNSPQLYNALAANQDSVNTSGLKVQTG